MVKPRLKCIVPFVLSHRKAQNKIVKPRSMCIVSFALRKWNFRLNLSELLIF